MKISADFAFLSMNWSETELKHLVWRLVLLFSEFFYSGEVSVGHGDCGFLGVTDVLLRN